MITRVCAYDRCAKPFTPKIKGRKQIYCATLCRVAAWQEANPRPRNISRRYERAYYYRNQETCQARALERYHLHCDCGQQKELASDEMCQECIAISSVAQALKS